MRLIVGYFKYLIEKYLFSYWYKIVLYDKSYLEKLFMQSFFKNGQIKTLTAYALYYFKYFKKDFPNEPCKLLSYFKTQKRDELQFNVWYLVGRAYVQKSEIIRKVNIEEELEYHKNFKRISKEEEREVINTIVMLCDADRLSFTNAIKIADIKLNKK